MPMLFTVLKLTEWLTGDASTASYSNFYMNTEHGWINGSFEENEALENEDRSTKRPNLENEDR